MKNEPDSPDCFQDITDCQRSFPSQKRESVGKVAKTCLFGVGKVAFLYPKVVGKVAHDNGKS